MQKLSALMGVAILFALTWAAGHDILKGEKDVWLEYTVVSASLLLAGVWLVVELKRLTKRLMDR